MSVLERGPPQVSCQSSATRLKGVNRFANQPIWPFFVTSGLRILAIKRLRGFEKHRGS